MPGGGWAEAELFRACRRGDLGRAQLLVEVHDADVNARDEWDSTPLYYSCLCGHEQLAQYLLEQGARCEAATFDGERCVFGALTDSIRNLLLHWRVLTPHTARRDGYAEFLRRARDLAPAADVTFQLAHGHLLPAHRCVLAARSPFFRRALACRWRRRRLLPLRCRRLQPDAFCAFLQFLYTGGLRASACLLPQLLMLADKAEMPRLRQQLLACSDRMSGLAAAKPGLSVNTIVVDPLMHQVREDFGWLADGALPLSQCSAVQQHMPFPAVAESRFADLCVEAEGQRFWCHRLFVCERCEYLRALADSPLGDAETVDGEDGEAVQLLRLRQLGASEFKCIMYFLYQDSCDIEEENAMELLAAADMLLLPRLKRRCADFLESRVDADTALPLLRVARLLQLPQLEEKCVSVCSRHLPILLPQHQFRSLVLEDARAVANREEADTIDIVDSIRYHIGSRCLTPDDFVEAQRLFRLIDDCLRQLGLEA